MRFQNFLWRNKTLMKFYRQSLQSMTMKCCLSMRKLWKTGFSVYCCYGNTCNHEYSNVFLWYTYNRVVIKLASFYIYVSWFPVCYWIQWHIIMASVTNWQYIIITYYDSVTTNVRQQCVHVLCTLMYSVIWNNLPL